MPDTVVYEYVTAVFDLAIPAAEGNLRVLREGEIVATTSITIGNRMAAVTAASPLAAGSLQRGGETPPRETPAAKTTPRRGTKLLRL